MIGLILLLSLWPFKHKHNPVGDIMPGPMASQCPAITDASDEGCITIPTCDQVGDTYFFTGDDKMTGISGASCEDAVKNWQNTHIDPVRMSRA